MTPQTITEIDALLGNKPHSKKELRAWRMQIWVTDDVFEKTRKTMTLGNIAFCSAAVYSTTCMSSATLCFQYVRISILRSTLYHVWKKKKISQLWGKKNKTGHILLTADCSQTNYFNRGGGECGRSDRFSANHRGREQLKDIKLLSKQIWLLLIKMLRGEKKNPASVLKCNLTAWTVLSLGRLSLLPSQLPVILYDV